MAVNASGMDRAVWDALKDYNDNTFPNEADRPRHLQVMGDAIRRYLEDNTTVTYGWAATSPPPASLPDPTVTFDSSVRFRSFDLSGATNPQTLAALVMASVMTGIISHPPAFAIPPGTFLAVAPPVFPSAPQYVDGILFNNVITPLAAWYLTLINPTPLPGSHGTFVGATTAMVIR